MKGTISFADNGVRKTIEPIYVIRDNRPFSIKDYDASIGTHIRLAKIDPTNEEFILQVANDNRDKPEVILNIAEEVPRNDIIVVEATIFPGINLFWLGSVMMMLGFFIALYRRFKSKYA